MLFSGSEGRVILDSSTEQWDWVPTSFDLTLLQNQKDVNISANTKNSGLIANVCVCVYLSVSVCMCVEDKKQSAGLYCNGSRQGLSEKWQ